MITIKPGTDKKGKPPTIGHTVEFFYEAMYPDNTYITGNLKSWKPIYFVFGHS